MYRIEGFPVMRTRSGCFEHVVLFVHISCRTTQCSTSKTCFSVRQPTSFRPVRVSRYPARAPGQSASGSHLCAACSAAAACAAQSRTAVRCCTPFCAAAPPRTDAVSETPAGTSRRERSRDMRPSRQPRLYRIASWAEFGNRLTGQSCCCQTFCRWFIDFIGCHYSTSVFYMRYLNYP